MVLLFLSLAFLLIHDLTSLYSVDSIILAPISHASQTVIENVLSMPLYG